MAKRTLPPLTCLQKATPTEVLEQLRGGRELLRRGVAAAAGAKFILFFVQSASQPARRRKNFLLNSTRQKYTFGSKQVEFPFQDRPILSRPFELMVGILQ